MKITQEGNNIRFQLYEKRNGDWRKVFDFSIHKNEYEQLKQHMIKALEEFDVK